VIEIPSFVRSVFEVAEISILLTKASSKYDKNNKNRLWSKAFLYNLLRTEIRYDTIIYMLVNYYINMSIIHNTNTNKLIPVYEM